MADKIVVQDNLLVEKTKVYTTSYKSKYAISAQVSNPSISAVPVQSLFEVPSSNIIDPYDIHIAFNFPAVTHDNANVAAMIAKNYCNYWTRLEAFTAQNNYLCNAEQLNIYSALTAPITLNASKRTEIQGFMHQSNRTVIPSGDGTNTLAITGDPFVQCQLPAKAYNEYSNFQTTTGKAINTPTIAKAYCIRLGDLCPDSFFNVSKKLYLSSPIWIRFTWNVKNNLVFGSDVNMANSIVYAGGDIAISNLRLITSIEADPLIVSIIQQRSKELEELVIPDLRTTTFSFGASTIQSTSVRVIPDAECKFWRMYYGLQTVDAVGDLNNLSNDNAKVTSITTNVNSKFLKTIQTALNEDFEDVLEYFDNHSLKSINSYKNFSTFVNVFDTEKYKGEPIKQELRGLDFMNGGEIVVNMQANTANNAYTHWAFCVVLKKIYMKNGILSKIPLM